MNSGCETKGMGGVGSLVFGHVPQVTGWSLIGSVILQFLHFIFAVKVGVAKGETAACVTGESFPFTESSILTVVPRALS